MTRRLGAGILAIAICAVLLISGCGLAVWMAAGTVGGADCAKDCEVQATRALKEQCIRRCHGAGDTTAESRMPVVN